MEADVDDVLMSELAVAATYKAKGQGAGRPVEVCVASSAPKLRKPSVLQTAGQGESHKGNVFRLMVPGPRATELAGAAVGGVTPTGGVLSLLPGDVFIVPGTSVNRPRAVTVEVTVKEGTPRFECGKWTCEVTA